MVSLQVEHLSYTYRESSKPALSEITFKVRAGEVLGVIGLNGSGKTTLTYCLCGIIPHYLKGTMQGTVLVNGKNTRETPLSGLSGEIGIVLQDPNLQLLMPTVEDDLAFALENHCRPRREIRETIDRVLELTGLAELRRENPVRLSGGEKQLVALATVLALNPGIIIFDEALAMLDEKASERIVAVMQKLKDEGKTLVLIDHTLKGLQLCHKIFLMEEGRIIRRGPRESILADQAYLRRHKMMI